MAAGLGLPSPQEGPRRLIASGTVEKKHKEGMKKKELKRICEDYAKLTYDISDFIDCVSLPVFTAMANALDKNNPDDATAIVINDNAISTLRSLSSIVRELREDVKNNKFREFVDLPYTSEEQ